MTMLVTFCVKSDKTGMKSDHFLLLFDQNFALTCTCFFCYFFDQNFPSIFTTFSTKIFPLLVGIFFVLLLVRPKFSLDILLLFRPGGLSLGTSYKRKGD